MGEEARKILEKWNNGVYRGGAAPISTGAWT